MSEDLNERQALMVLNGLPGIGPISTTRLLNHFAGDPQAIFITNEKALLEVEGIGKKNSRTILDWPKNFDLKREETLLEKHGARFVTIKDEQYPALLREIYDPPAGLYFLGEGNLGNSFAAIVGTRRPTLYGRSVARRLAGDLTRLGFCVVSGFARGIDSEAHEGALEAGGKTVAILGCGLDIIYPSENLELYRKISQADAGAVVSEFSFGRRADRQTFPMRNRLISGMCQVVVVVESDLKGGSMITARFAGEQGRLIFAVPGRIDQSASRGCNRLIRDGATLFSSIEDLIDELRYTGQMQLGLESVAAGIGVKEPLTGKFPSGNLSESEKTIAQCFADGAILYPDTVGEITKLPLNEVTAGLMMLELNRILRKRADGSYEQTA